MATLTRRVASNAKKAAAKIKTATPEEENELNTKEATPDDGGEDAESPAPLPTPNTSGWTDNEVSRLYELQTRCDASEQEWSALKKSAGEAKKSYDSDVHALLRFIRGLNSDQDRPLLTGQDGAGVTVDDLLLTALDDVLSASDAAVLRRAGMATVGDIAKFSQGDAELTEISGVGEKTAERINEALVRCWQEHPVDIAALSSESGDA